ncbi:glutamine-hydrolyzing carbamoyl-phosphate synthase small subunit [Neolewinella antarctica]|uniref:Carbamoyl phosphate synthase small chain n=1 Tax=Neolewinella antarctica TaxID=442734 RepID=A0ABX0XEU4_9BACT|nr:glutamine-hydrolyzing carbamoyl-phosphate synthase small subunit [Neolewinella antarctica]NJC27404.1 carbamoyl-phosphate synthase small subunit [Neolewinella antarctica]
MDQQRAILLLADGTTFEGKAAGKIGTTVGEICFNTGMTGYQEVFTDPSYYGQILLATNAHIGNYGTADADIESDSIKIAGLIVKNFTIPFSRNLANASIQDYLEQGGLVGISDVDTRAIVRHIRTKGAMNGIISSEIFDLDELNKRLAAAPNMDGLELSSKVTTKEAYTLGEEEQAKYRVAVLDLGTKKNILRNFLRRDCFVKVFPAKTGMDEIRAFNADGLFISNGPGDPAAMDYAVDTAKAMLEEEKPMFGICLGHQILARAVDIPTYKMHHGHRGINHPVKNLITGKSEITSQNHGFGVSPEAIAANLDKVEITHRNLNDDTIEGIRIVGKPAFSVQYHPEASPGPHDADYLFDQFVELIREKKE